MKRGKKALGDIVEKVLGIASLVVMVLIVVTIIIGTGYMIGLQLMLVFLRFLITHLVYIVTA